MGQQHFVAKIEVAPAFDPEELTEEDLDVDHLEQIASMISDSESAEFDDDLTPRQFKFELCPTCSRQYLNSPLGPARPAPRLKYSQN